MAITLLLVRIFRSLWLLILSFIIVLFIGFILFLLTFRFINFFLILVYLWKDASNLLLQQQLKLAFHILIKTIFITELFS